MVEQAQIPGINQDRCASERLKEKGKEAGKLEVKLWQKRTFDLSLALNVLFAFTP